MLRAGHISIFLLVAFLTVGCTGSEKQLYRNNVDNIIIIAIDTVRANHLGFMGYGRETSPFLDELAGQSVIFDRAFCTKSLTLPSFAALYTGLHTIHNKVYKNMWPLEEDLHSLVEDFQTAGFKTMFFSASAILDAKYRIDKGFDIYIDARPHPQIAADVIEKVKKETEEINEPLFMVVHFWEPHSPYDPDPDVLALFADPDYEGPMDGSVELLNQYTRREVELNEADIRHAVDRYDGEIRWIDDQLRELFNYFEEKDLIDNSLIIITSDHGERLGEGHIFQHRRDSTIELHIPLILHFPGDIGAGIRIPALVEITDILPTVMDILDIPIPEGIDGMSLFPLIKDPTLEHRTKLLSVGINDPGYFLYSEYDGRRRWRIEAPVEEPEPHWLPEQDRERLRALGYIH